MGITPILLMGCSPPTTPASPARAGLTLPPERELYPTLKCLQPGVEKPRSSCPRFERLLDQATKLPTTTRAETLDGWARSQNPDERLLTALLLRALPQDQLCQLRPTWLTQRGAHESNPDTAVQLGLAAAEHQASCAGTVRAPTGRARWGFLLGVTGAGCSEDPATQKFVLEAARGLPGAEKVALGYFHQCAALFSPRDVCRVVVDIALGLPSQRQLSAIPDACSSSDAAPIPIWEKHLARDAALPEQRVPSKSSLSKRTVEADVPDSVKVRALLSAVRRQNRMAPRQRSSSSLVSLYGLLATVQELLPGVANSASLFAAEAKVALEVLERTERISQLWRDGAKLRSQGLKALTVTNTRWRDDAGTLVFDSQTDVFHGCDSGSGRYSAAGPRGVFFPGNGAERCAKDPKGEGPDRATLVGRRLVLTRGGRVLRTFQASHPQRLDDLEGEWSVTAASAPTWNHALADGTSLVLTIEGSTFRTSTLSGDKKLAGSRGLLNRARDRLWFFQLHSTGNPVLALVQESLARWVRGKRGAELMLDLRGTRILLVRRPTPARAE